MCAATWADPGYEQLDVAEMLRAGGLVPIASGQGHDGAVSIRQRDAVLRVGRLGPDERVVVPDAPFAHVYVARGSASMDAAGELGTGDAVRLAGAGPQWVTAGPEGTEIVVWTTGPR